MQKTVLILIGMLLTSYAISQHPVHWSYSVKKLSPTIYELHLTANIEEGWHVYSQRQPEDAIALPTKIKFNKNPLAKTNGPILENGRLEKHKMETLEVEQYQYSNKVDFVQVFELKRKEKINITGSVTFQVCSEELCLPAQEETFTLALL